MIPQPFIRLLAAAALTVAGQATAENLFNYVPAAKDARADGVVSPASILVDAQAIARTDEGGTLEATLPDGRAVAILIQRLERHDNGELSWSGQVLDAMRPDLAARGTTGAAGSYATIETAEGEWGVMPSQKGHDWIFDKKASDANRPPRTRLDDAIPVPDAQVMPRAKATCPTVSSLPTPQVTIDVLAVVAPDFVSAHGGAAGAETRLNNIFSNMNAYLAASNIAITYRRVGTMNAGYQAASTAGDDDSAALDAITNARGSFANVPALRSFFGADMVALFRGPQGGGNTISGVAWLTGDGNGGLYTTAANYMFSVHGDAPWADATLSAHELGHNLGNEHNRANAGSSGTSTPYSYGHYVCGSGAASNCGQAGFTNAGTGFGTIMSYVSPTARKFGSPNVMCRASGSSLSAPCGVDGQQDDVRASNCVRQQAAAIRASWVGTCNLAADADNDGIPDCLEAPSGRSNGARDNDVFGNGLLFAAQQYRDFLSREGDADGLNYWMTALNTGASNRTAMIEGFLTSAEFQGVIAPVARLYFAYFLRIPDYAGLQYWIGQYKSGVSLAAISQRFAASTEFSQRYGSLTNAQFVTLVYNNVLARAPDSTGLSYWTGQLAAGMSRGDVMLAFSESAEYRALMGNEIYVTMAYIGMLRRSPDSGGFSYWTSYLDAGSKGSALVSGFLASPEYRSRFLP